MGLSRRLTHVLVLTGLNRPPGVTPMESATCTRVLVRVPLVGPLLDRNLVVGVDDEKVKEGERLIFPGLRSWLSRSRESARKRERQREREKDTGTQALMEQRCFNQHGVGIYTVLQVLC